LSSSPHNISFEPRLDFQTTQKHHNFLLVPPKNPMLQDD